MSHSNEAPASHLMPLLGCAHHKAHQYLDRRMKQYDLTPAQAHTLLYLRRETPKREVNQKDLEEHLRIRPSTVSGIVERLEQKGLLCRTASVADARCRSLTLTERGNSFGEEFFHEAGAAERHIASLFTEEESAQLREMLQRIITALQSEENESC